MKRIENIPAIFLIIISLCSCTDSAGIADQGISVTVSINGRDYGGADGRTWAHACWIEDESQTTLQALSITNFHFGVSGVALPIWNRTESDTGDGSNIGAAEELDDQAAIDAVTAATVDGEFSIVRTLSFNTESVRRFYILLEVDRSFNDNEYFSRDRPSYLYISELIDLDNLHSDYSFELDGWMCNGTVGTTAGYDQSPDLDNPAFDTAFKSTYFSTVDDASYVYVPEPEFLVDLPSEGSNYDDMINSITATITSR